MGAYYCDVYILQCLFGGTLGQLFLGKMRCPGSRRESTGTLKAKYLLEYVVENLRVAWEEPDVVK